MLARLPRPLHKNWPGEVSLYFLCRGQCVKHHCLGCEFFDEWIPDFKFACSRVLGWRIDEPQVHIVFFLIFRSVIHNRSDAENAHLFTFEYVWVAAGKMEVEVEVVD